MSGLASYELWFGGGVLVMALAGLLFVAQTVLFVLKKKSIARLLDQEYGQPQKYTMSAPILMAKKKSK